MYGILADLFGRGESDFVFSGFQRHGFFALIYDVVICVCYGDIRAGIFYGVENECDLIAGVVMRVLLLDKLERGRLSFFRHSRRRKAEHE